MQKKRKGINEESRGEVQKRKHAKKTKTLSKESEKRRESSFDASPFRKRKRRGQKENAVIEDNKGKRPLQANCLNPKERKKKSDRFISSQDRTMQCTQCNAAERTVKESTRERNMSHRGVAALHPNAQEGTGGEERKQTGRA
mmetsp:Transcript_15309/g.31036  ORF Transcript_15309/g.31036 Transcript_15309/m.31036 type:complete len:142 (-) Transcript_15309:159-584(-)